MTARDVVKHYHNAWTTGDVELAMSHLSDDVICRAPGANLVGKQAYREFIAGFAPRLTGIDEIAEFADGDRVALFHHPHTAVTSCAPAAECFTVRGGVIVENVLIFDRLSFAPSGQEDS